MIDELAECIRVGRTAAGIVEVLVVGEDHVADHARVGTLDRRVGRPRGEAGGRNTHFIGSGAAERRIGDIVPGPVNGITDHMTKANTEGSKSGFEKRAIGPARRSRAFEVRGSNKCCGGIVLVRGVTGREAMTTRSNIFRRARSVCAVLALGALAEVPAPAAAAANWRIDPARTEIAFAIDAVGYPRTEGKFRRFEGRISIDFEHPDKSGVAFHVQSGSVDVGSASFSDYIRSVAFLNSAKYPSIDFDFDLGSAHQ